MARDKLVIFAADMQEGHLTQGKFKQTSGVQGYSKINSYSEAVLPKKNIVKAGSVKPESPVSKN